MYNMVSDYDICLYNRVLDYSKTLETVCNDFVKWDWFKVSILYGNTFPKIATYHPVIEIHKILFILQKRFTP